MPVTHATNEGSLARDRLGAFLLDRRTFLAVMVLTLALTGVGNAATLFGFAIVLATLWASRWDWAYLGLRRPRWARDLLRSAKYTLAIIVVVDALAQPAVDRLLGTSPDLSGFQFLVGNELNLLLFLAFMWGVAAFGEEVFFRGHLMGGWARAFGGGNRFWLLGAGLSTLCFGLAHAYQGPSGVVTTAMVGAILSAQFYRGRDRLASCVLTHGLYDTVGIALIYLDRPDALGKIFL